MLFLFTHTDYSCVKLGKEVETFGPNGLYRSGTVRLVYDVYRDFRSVVEGVRRVDWPET